MSDPIELTVAHPTRRIRFAPIRRLIQLVAKEERVSIQTLSVIFADHAAFRGLTRRHKGRVYQTDVLAFDMREDPGRGPLDGEIYVDLDTAAERAPEFGARYTDEVHRYVVHGQLHLIGYRDDTETGKAAMRELEDRYLRSLQATHA